MMDFDLQKMSPLEALELMDRVAKMDGDATVPPQLAAVYLGVAEKTLGNWRGNGCGPAYIQPASSKARNQGVNYKMRSLRDWQGENSVVSTMDAAKRRGMAFSTINDLAEPAPFWQSKDEEPLIFGSFDYETTKTLAEGGVAAEVGWMQWDDAMMRKWASPEARKPFHDAYVGLLSDMIESAKIMADKERLETMLPAAKSRARNI